MVKIYDNVNLYRDLNSREYYLGDRDKTGYIIKSYDNDYIGCSTILSESSGFSQLNHIHKNYNLDIFIDYKHIFLTKNNILFFCKFNYREHYSMVIDLNTKTIYGCTQEEILEFKDNLSKRRCITFKNKSING
jgi:hypothetical protein